ncbi:MAG TPA: hypothetical protein VIM70_08535, partial [Clostridium sp.]|uniref:hypothetical protein n=1 Tax=Clostridium sp. TaxID=1506 RepID=UPI002F94B31B
ILNICGVGLFCYIKGWNSLMALGNGLTLLSFIYIAIGAAAFTGSYGVRSDGRINYARSAGAANLAERTKQDMASTLESYRFLLLIWAVGFLSLTVAWFIPTFNFAKDLTTFLQ